MKNTVRVYVTDFETLTLGPKFSAVFDHLEKVVADNPRWRKQRKEAKKTMLVLEDGICKIALAFWDCGKRIGALP